MKVSAKPAPPKKTVKPTNLSVPQSKTENVDGQDPATAALPQTRASSLSPVHTSPLHPPIPPPTTNTEEDLDNNPEEIDFFEDSPPQKNTVMYQGIHHDSASESPS